MMKALRRKPRLRIPKKTDVLSHRVLVRAVLLDLDGTLYLVDKPVNGARDAVERLRASGIKVLFITNNSSKQGEDVAKKLKRMGIKAHRNEIYTSGYALATYINDKLPGMSVYCVSGGGMQKELQKRGIKVVKNDSADIVAVGLDRKVTYDKIATATDALRKGAVFLASNEDETMPTPNGPKPGSGSIVAAISKASGRIPFVIGKPSPYMLRMALKEHRLKKAEAIVVGDKLDTDIAAAKKAGIKSILVLTGITKRVQTKGKMKPDFVLRSVKQLPNLLSGRG